MRPSDDSTDALVTEHLAVVSYQVKALMSRLPAHVHRDDLVSAGHLALVRAAKSYDESTGVPFARWAALRIRGALVDELRSMDWATRQARQRANRVAQVANELASTLGRSPTQQDLAEATGMTVDEVSHARSVADVRILSMDAGPDDTALAESVPDTSLGPEALLLADERTRYLHAAVQSLPDKMRQVVQGVFFEERPVVEIAAELGITQSRVSQLRTEAMALLRDGLNASLDPDLVAVPDRPEGVVERRRQAYYARVAATAAASAVTSSTTRRPERTDARTVGVARVAG